MLLSCGKVVTSYPPPAPSAAYSPCTETVTARVVALDTAIFANRLGAQVPGGMIYVLMNDAKPTDGAPADDWTQWNPGEVGLKGYKRARPIVLRVNKGQCLEIEFRNLLADATLNLGDTTTREAGVFVQGMEWVNGPQDDASWVGANSSSLIEPSQPGDPSKTYKLFAREEGPFLLYSTGDDFTTSTCPAFSQSSPCKATNDTNPGGGGYTVDSELSPAGGDGGQLTQGMFGAVMVQPEYAEYYRSQVNHDDLCLASKDKVPNSNPCERNPDTLPEIDYQAKYPAGHARAGLPILNMLNDKELVHSDLTAIITGPKAGRFPKSDLPKPEFHPIGPPDYPDQQTYPDRLEPYREFTIIYHELLRSAQAFNQLYQDPQLKTPLEAGGDNFAINYGMGGIGSEILANRLKVGPMAECTDCKYEEFFLSSWPNGDPAMIVDHPADNGCEETGNGFPTYKCDSGHVKATRAYYPDDPSNVYHSYLWDHTKFRILHGGVALHHLHHLHAHQWLGSPNTSKGHYLDSQAIGPGSAFTLETVYNGGGNKNLTVGDSIFHCHFYPHFAAGMWALWRVHDVFEEGTELEGYPQGRPKEVSRALPDGEIVKGTPIPALVPLPTKAMAPVPAPVKLLADGTQIEVCQGTQGNPNNCISNLAASGTGQSYDNPGYPFFIPGIGGSRAVHPPLDFALACKESGEPCDTAGASCGGAATNTCEPLDGGLPRHIVAATATHAPGINPLDFSKDVESATGIGIPEQGTVIEKVAMAFHEKMFHATALPKTGDPAQYRTNGHKPAPGAPYAEPCIDLAGKRPSDLREINYWAVDIQTEAVYNKEGWHYPQQRMLSLWGDAFDFLGLNGPRKAPEPFFFRANSQDCINYRLANLIPKTYELDDFQVRTPTDVLGQHIHLVKFDVTSSDGAANGFNYEDGTLAPDEVVERINAFNNGEFLPEFGAAPQATPLEPEFIKYFGADPLCASNPSGVKCGCELTEKTETKDNKTTTHWSVAGGRWCGSQATVQRWYVDPQLIDTGKDRTMRTVFTHDHFSPSTHQQTGLYAGLVAEPQFSKWFNNQDGSPLGGQTRSQNGVNLKDGGPTSWQAVIKTKNSDESFREFLIEFQDTTLMYQPFPEDVADFDPQDLSACPNGFACGFCSNDHTIACVTDSNSGQYYGTVCDEVDLPNPNGDDSKLEPSCNFIAGIPSSNSLFSSEKNVWGVTSGSQFDALQKVGWDTWPISPSPSGVFVQNSQTNENIQNAAAQPELISFGGGTSNFSLNYRNEPIYSRINSTAGPADGNDLGFVYQSLARTLPGQQPPPYPPLTPGVGNDDPFTPLLRAYGGDDVQIRVLVGAHQNPHNFTVHSTKWLFEPSNINSGWRNTQTMGISEHFEFLFKLPPPLKQPNFQDLPSADYLYKATAARQGQSSGNWGLLRAYNGKLGDLEVLPQNQMDPGPEPIGVCPASLMDGDQPKACGTTDSEGHQVRCFDVVATRAEDILDKPLTYTTKASLGYHTPNALLYLHKSDYDDLNNTGTAPGFDKANGLAEPLVLRAAAGDCIQVTLENKLEEDTPVGQPGNGNGYRSGRLPVAGQAPDTKDLYVTSNTSPSRDVGLRPQLVTYNVAQSDGSNVGNNSKQTAGPGESVSYYWYAGNIDRSLAKPHIPIEFGAANLLPSDPINHHAWGLFGGLIIEPEGSSWTHDQNSRASATVTLSDETTTFREFVLLMQDDIYMHNKTGRQGNVGAFNYRTDLLNDRTGSCPPPANDVSCVLSETAGAIDTPILCAKKGDPARFRLLHPGGAVTNNVFELHGHVFAEEPYSTSKAHCEAPLTQTNLFASNTIDVGNQCPDGNVALGPSLTEWKASRMGHGPTNHFDIVVEKAGGQYERAGDYLYRSYPSVHFKSGIWGIFRVTAGDPSADVCPSF